MSRESSRTWTSPPSRRTRCSTRTAASMRRTFGSSTPSCGQSEHCRQYCGQWHVSKTADLKLGLWQWICRTVTDEASVFIPYVVPETHERRPVCVTGMVLTTPVALILIGVELQCSHNVSKELGIEKSFPQSGLPAVTATREASVAVLLVNAWREQEARIGEDLKKKKESEKAGRMSRSKWTPLQRDCATWSLCSRPCFRTPRGNPAQSTQSHRILNNPQSHVQNLAQSRHNHVLTTRSNQIGKIMTPVWVAVGLRWIWWFLVCNLWLVSRLYLQPDMSACQSSCLSCPQFQKTDESFSHPVSILKLSPCHYRCSGWNIRTEYLERHELNSSDSTANICTQTFASGQKLVFAASGENAILHCKAVNLKLTRILKWLKIFFLTYHY